MSQNSPAVVEMHAQAAVRVDPSQPITDLDQAVRLCDNLARSDLVPRGLQGKPANVFVVIMAGQEMGLSWPVALRTIYSPGPGQVGVRGELLLAKLHEAGHEYDWEEDPGVSCTFRLERYGADPQRKTRAYTATFTMEDAIQAGLARRNEKGDVVALSRENKPLPWMQYSQDMLFWRAVARAVKRGAPEILMGFEVQGADTREPEAEVELKVASEVKPPAGPEFERASEEQLRRLDERMREAEGGDPDTHLAEQHEREDREQEYAATWTEEDHAEAVEADLASHGIEPDPQEPPADRAKGQVLAERFEALGWHPRKHRADLNRACSMFLRRPVRGSRDMTTAEIMSLAQELGRLQRSYPEPQHPVALADKVELWREQWQQQDPEGYGEYAGD